MLEKHPHVCGEDSRTCALASRKPETPPRVWGRRFDCLCSPVVRRNTPTGVGKCRRLRHRREPLGNTPTSVRKIRRYGRRIPRIWKHPHGRGEDTRSTSPSRPLPETPPRSRGKPGVSAKKPRASGNTPTFVGKTSSQTMRQGLPKKHPHIRGEDLKLRLSKAVVRETPPRSWGGGASTAAVAGCARADTGEERRLLLDLNPGVLAVDEIAVFDDLLESHAVQRFDLRVALSVCGHFLQPFVEGGDF